MKWEGEERSENVEDRRGLSKPALAMGGGGLTVVIMIAAYFLGIDPNQAKQVAQVIGGGQQQAQQGQAPGKDDRTRAFAETVLKMTENVWGDQFKKLGRDYEKPRFVLFSDSVDSGCGRAPAAVGPFYCPADKKLYLDPSFFDELQDKLGGSKGEFSQAYVIAHEIGHHVQNLLGYSARVDSKRGTNLEKDYSVRLELQADYLAGVWAFHARKNKPDLVDAKDIESALTTAQSIGDDRLQKRSQGWTSPETYTHGTSDQRIRCFKKGLETGDFSKAALDRFFEVAKSGDL